MKITILGAGAMGSLYGAMLSKGENEVWLLDIAQDHVNAINKKGLLVESDGIFKAYQNLKATTNPEAIGISDLVIIFVKSTFTRQAVESNLAVFGPKTMILTLQNGLGNVEEIKKATNQGHIIAGTTAHGATLLEYGKIRHAGVGKTIIGELDGRLTSGINQLKEDFQQCGLETEVSDNVMGILWDKLLVNVGINAITGLVALENGKLAEIQALEEIMTLAVEEGMAVAHKKGIKLISEDPVAHTKAVCLATAKNKSSMLQDILNHRKTEIDRINGAIVNEGLTLGIQTPVNMVLTNLIKGKQG